MWNHPSGYNRYRPVSAICVLVVLAAGGTSLAGWWFGHMVLAGLTQEWIPMAPSTALLFVLCGVALLLRLFLHRSLGAWWASTLMVSACGSIALILLTLSSRGIHPALEHLGMTITGAVGLAPIGHMSPVAALCRGASDGPVPCGRAGGARAQTGSRPRRRRCT